MIKKIENKIEDFFMKSMDYSKNEGILALVIFLLCIIIGVSLLFLFSTVIGKIGTVYVLLSIFFTIYLTEAYNDTIEYTITIFLLPYIILLMVIDKIFLQFIPYRGNDPLLIRKYKLRTLKRMIIKNKLKFWKR